MTLENLLGRLLERIEPDDANVGHPQLALPMQHIQFQHLPLQQAARGGAAALVLVPQQGDHHHLMAPTLRRGSTSVMLCVTTRGHWSVEGCVPTRRDTGDAEGRSDQMFITA